MIKSMVKGYCNCLMVIDMREIGKMINSMVKVFTFMKTEINMKGSSKMIKSMDLVYFNGIMKKDMKESGKKINFVGKENIYLLMVMCMRENGTITSILVKVLLNLKTEIIIVFLFWMLMIFNQKKIKNLIKFKKTVLVKKNLKIFYK